MNKEQAVTYLKFSGFSDEQIKAIEGAFTCEYAISRKAVIQHICESKECYKENCKGVLFNRCMDISWVNDELPSVNPLPKALTKEERALLQRWRDGRGISMEEFAKALELLEGSEVSE